MIPEPRDVIAAQFASSLDLGYRLRRADELLAALKAAGFRIVTEQDWRAARQLVDPDGEWE